MKKVVSFGGGVNSTAMLLGMYERDQRPDLILFADTGGEKTPTYEYLGRFSRWCEEHSFPAITVVREERWTLEEELLRTHSLPSIVMGFRSCSDKFKIRPQNRYLVANGFIPCTKVIGFDAGESHRIKNFDDKRFTLTFPLVEWGWARCECVDAIKRHGLPIPIKSSCFFCPEMQWQEIIQLRADEPELYGRAIAMEQNATALHSIKGLSRSMSWSKVVELVQLGDYDALPKRVKRMPCVCFDGEEE